MTFEEANIVAFDRLIGCYGNTAAVIRWRWIQAGHQHEARMIEHLTTQLWQPSPVSASLASENWPIDPEHLDERGSEPA